MLWTFLEGLIPRNPIRPSSFPPTAILVLLAQTGSRYYSDLRRRFSSAIPSPGSALHKAATQLEIALLVMEPTIRWHFHKWR